MMHRTCSAADGQAAVVVAEYLLRSPEPKANFVLSLGGEKRLK
jgi:hypothetical protein